MKIASTTQNPVNGSSNNESADTEGKSALKKQLQCGSCVGLVRSPVLEVPCNQVGKLPTSRSCGSHQPDVFTLAGGEEKVNLMLTIADVMARMSVNDLQILASLMLNEKTTRKHGFKFKQKVYLRVQGQTNSNYLSNFAVGYVLDANKDTVRLIGESGTMSVSCLNEKDSCTLYTVARFNVLREQMLKDRKFIDPAVQKIIIPAPKETNVKTLDAAFDDGLLKKKSRKERGDLVSLVSRLSKGHLRVDKAENVVKAADSSGSTVRFNTY